MEFITRMKFWIALGVIVLVSGVAFGVLFVPSRGKSTELMDEWKGVANDVNTLAQQNRIPNNQSIQKARDLQGRYEQDRDAVLAVLLARDKLIEDYIPDPEDDSRVPRVAPMWKSVYAAAMAKLNTEIRKRFDDSAPVDLVRAEAYGEEWPTKEEMRRQAKRYWMQRYLLETIASVNDAHKVVPELVSYEYGVQPDRMLHTSHGKSIRPVGFSIVIMTEVEQLPKVVETLLNCPIGLSVTSIQLDRGILAAGAGGGRRSGRRGPAGARSRGTGRPQDIYMGPPPGTYMGPPPGTYMGPPPGTYMGPMGPPAGTFMGPRPGAMSGGPSASRTRRGPGGPRRAAAAGQPAAQRKAAETGRRRLVSITIKGYVEDYNPPESQEQQEEEPAE